MADVIDQAETEIETYINSRIQAARTVKNKLTPQGSCHYCYEDVEYPKLFCDGVCATEHDCLTKRM